MNAAHVLGIQRYDGRFRLAWRCGVALLLGLLPTAALACTPPPGGVPVYTIAQHVRAADVVLRGTITQVTVKDFQNYTATISVQQYFKGNGPATVTITDFGTGADCRSSVRAGEEGIFFANGDPSALMHASYLSQVGAVSTPDADTIAQIIAAVNSRPRSYLPLLVGGGVTQAVASAPQSADERALFGLVFVVVGALGVCLRFAVRWL